MATIQKRVRYRATVSGLGGFKESRSFAKESQARGWAERTRESAVETGLLPDDLKTRISQKATYRVMIRRVGCPTQYATFDRKSDANRWVEETETDIRRGLYFKTVEAKRHTVAELIDRYREEVLAQKRPRTRQDQARHLRWWRERLGSRSLANVTPALLSEQRAKLAGGRTVRGRRRSPATVNRYLSSLGHALEIAAREWEWLSDNPMRRVGKLREPRGRVRFLSEEERGALLAACQESDDPRLYAIVVLAISTGARRGELLGLKWGDLDWQRSLAVLHETKNGERRAVPIQGTARDVLLEMSRVRRLDTDLVFAGHEAAASFPRKGWEEALRIAEVDDFRFHDLRHTAASYLAMSGATLAEIAEVLGHKTLAMVKRYSHLSEQHTSQVVARMNERFLGT